MKTPTLSRRRVLTNLGIGAAGAGAAGAGVLTLGDSADAALTSASVTAAACHAESTEQEVGPFYVAEGLVRSNIVAGEDGIPLTITVTYLDAETCEPAAGLAADIWHANAAGVYSDEQSESTVGETYLRGIQITDAQGQVRFTTIYPGWYQGRTIHIHDRVYSGGAVSGTSYSYSGATLLYTGQWFFPAGTSTTVAGTAPYSSNKTTRTVNSTDHVFTDQNGADHVLTLTGSTGAGFTGSLTLYVDAGGSTTSDEDISSITLATSATTLTAGQPLTVHGVLTDTTTSKPIAGGAVLLTRTVDGVTGTAKVTTDSKGVWTLTMHPTRTATYEATYAGDDAHHASSSAKHVVRIRYRLVLADVSATASHTRTIVASGTLTPADAGTTVVLSRVTSDGTRHRITTATTDAQGRWSARWKMGKGKHRVVATVAATGFDLGAKSRVVTVHRT